MQAVFCRPGLACAHVARAGTAALLMLMLSNGGPAAAADAMAPPQAPVVQLAQAAQAALPPATAPMDDYQLSTSDRVRVIVYGQPEMTAEYAINGAGEVAFPLIGRVKANGLTTTQLEQAIATKLNEGFLKDASVSVEVTQYRPFYVVGEVRTPGSYPFVWGMSVINAVALAGGFTYRAKENDFYLLRADKDGRKTRMSVKQDTPVLPGDVITVRERWF
ncbi:MAG: polysaccharide export protein [Alphaproteobacteria bacterium]|nr:polysaccharide export protein [Alphaproteobacteria bacterium]